MATYIRDLKTENMLSFYHENKMYLDRQGNFTRMPNSDEAKNKTIN